jgi:type I restriction enzyme S subunit
MEKYQSYKPSGVEWIGEIPEKWRISKFKYVSKLYTGNSLNDEQKVLYESEDEYHIPYVSSKDIDLNTRSVNYNNGLRIPKENNPLKVSPKDSFLLCVEGGSSGRKMVYLDREVCFVNKLCSFKSVENTRFQYYFIQSSNFQDKFKLSLSGLIGGVSISTLRDFELVLPSIQEQHQIVQFLDNKTELIDKLISTKERKITLLKEQRTSLINQVVTKGLNPNVKLKDSGVEWIGEIPEHWKSCNLRYVLELLTDFESNGSFSSVKENVKVDDEGEVWYVRMTDLENNNIRNEKCKYCDLDTYNFLHKTKVYGGELLITKRGEIGKVYLFPYNCGLSTLGPNSYLLRLKNIVNSHFLYFFYISDIGQTTLKLLDNSTTIGSLYKDDIKGSSVIVPPIDEQQQIVEYLVSKTKEIDDLVQLEQKKIDLLKQYRQSLISEVVTGKIKVTN